jgi:DnaK suppressor protein
VKAPAKKSAKPAQPVKAKATTKKAAPAAKAPVAKAKPPVKTPPKAAAPVKAKAPAVKPVVKSSKSSSPAVSKASKPAASAKSVISAAKSSVKGAAKPAAKTPVRSAPPTAAKPVTKPAPQASAKAPTASKPAASAATKPAKPAPGVAVAPVSKPAPKASTPKGSGAQPVVQPTPRPLGKRAAKKVMMEQMTQAEVVPTHSANAAKATFSTMNERVVMTPPVPSAIRKDPKRANNWKTLPVGELTDEDILAMPDSEYMGELQLSYFRRKLSQLRADMLANAGETTEHLREDTVVVPDPADRATIEEEHALELRTRDRERKLLKKIEQAIGRIDSGDYGYCDETGEAIGVGRLMARPTASLSLEAQQRRELKQKMFGD